MLKHMMFINTRYPIYPMILKINRVRIGYWKIFRVRVGYRGPVGHWPQDDGSFSSWLLAFVFITFEKICFRILSPSILNTRSRFVGIKDNCTQYILRCFQAENNQNCSKYCLHFLHCLVKLIEIFQWHNLLSWKSYYWRSKNYSISIYSQWKCVSPIWKD